MTIFYDTQGLKLTEQSKQKIRIIGKAHKDHNVLPNTIINLILELEGIENLITPELLFSKSELIDDLQKLRGEGLPQNSLGTGSLLMELGLLRKGKRHRI